MITIEQLAQEAYSEHLKEIKAHFSHPLNWHQLMTYQQDAWIAATRHIVERAKEVH